MCGGTGRSGLTIWAYYGLSPRVRGNLLAACLDLAAERSIPACAGEPKATVQSAVPSGGLSPPCAGGTVPCVPVLPCLPSLSPRVRGNQVVFVTGVSKRRSIPACAGEPNNCIPSSCDPPVYPRVCGGTGCCGGASRRIRGLSPRVRGNLVHWDEQEEHRRSIPACAGEPHNRRSTGPDFGVYPRVCGGTIYALVSHAIHNGLSPRVRGNHGGGVCFFNVSGSIPACAGEP